MWVLVLGAIGGVVAASYLYYRMNDEIRHRVEAMLSQHYTNLKVSIRSAYLVEGEGIEVRGLSIVEPGADGPAELIYIDEVMLRCSTDWRDLIAEKPQVTEIRIRRSTLRPVRRPDGTYGISKLLPVPKFSDRPPKVIVENSVVEIFDPQKNPSGMLTLREVNLVLTCGTASNSGMAVSAVTNHDKRILQGTLTGDHLRRATFQGVVDLKDRSWSIGGVIEGLELSGDLYRSLPGPLAEKLAALGGLRGGCAAKFQVAFDPSAKEPYRYELSGRLVHGRIDDPRLPHSLTDIRATFRLSNERLDVSEMVARSNQATLRLSYRQDGFEPTSPRMLQASVRQLELDDRLLECLPEQLQDQWHKYRPSGLVDAEVKLSFDGRNWRPDVSARCQNVSFAHYKFPYRLDHGKGTLQLKNEHLEVHLTAHNGNRPVRLDAEVHNLNSNPVGWFEAKAEAIPIDEKLVVALPEGPRRVVRSLRPRGTVDFYVRLSRLSADVPLRKHLLIGLNRCSIKYEKFPYPLSNIHGVIEMLDDRWVLRDLEGTNDTGRVTGEGYFTPVSEGHELLLKFAAADVPLDEELRDALKPDIRRIWNDLRPKGRIGIGCDVRYLPDQRRLSVGVRVEPQDDSVSICPVQFPYRLEKLHGVLVYNDGHVTLQRLKAEHGPVKLSASGHCDLMPDGQWRMHFDRLAIDRLRLDRELMGTMPERVKKTLGRLNLEGPVSLRGSFDLVGDARTGHTPKTQWDMNVCLHQGALDCGMKLENIYGSATFAGASDGRQFHCRGELDIDSLTYKDCQFTEVRGPVWIDERRVLLGSWVDRQETGTSAIDGSEPKQSRPLSAKLFGGIVFGDAWVAKGATPQYAVHAVLTRADLSRCAQEVMNGRQNLRGTVMATLDLHGNGFSRNAMVGRGNIRLREANIYELPLMIAMLKILSIRMPDPNAFSTSDIDFRIQGEHIYFDQINFKGDAISLFGKGEMNLQQDVRLTFHATVGRGELDVPIIKELFRGASQQIMLIHVDGTLQNPKTCREAFPGVNQALQQLTDELQMVPEARQWMPNVEHGIRVRK